LVNKTFDTGIVRDRLIAVNGIRLVWPSLQMEYNSSYHRPGQDARPPNLRRRAGGDWRL